MFSHESFDATASLALMYLWMFFAFFSVLLSCDLQRIAQKNVYIQHLLAFAALFYLITLIDPNNNMNVIQTWQKTLIIYLLFIMSTKAKWPFVAALIVILLADLTLKTHIDFKKKKNEDASKIEPIRKYMRIAVFVIIIAGFIHYAFRALKHHRKDFSWVKFIIGTGQCKSRA